MKKIFMSGCGGMLGEAFYEVFKTSYQLKCTDIDLNEEWLSYLDFRNLDAYFSSVQKFMPDYLFHIGAHTDLEYCETNINDAYLTNTTSVENAVFVANSLDIPLLYISTAGIFDGKQDIYDDWALPNPICHYARSKYAGEQFVLQHAKFPIVLRAGWMMGGGPKKDKKFVSKILNQIKLGKKTLHIVNDKLGTPTYTYDFANNAKIIIENKLWGLYNLVCQGVTGRLEVAKRILSVCDLETKIEIIEVNSEHFTEDYFVARPNSERLINKKLQLRGLDQMRDWKICLDEYLTESYKDFL
ncbi:sugar nucleotide-binding protein [Gammaproteobacteria bacterium]|jgi:dTDP-4-dehydrorhamnose reductase|nr:sugar nucleotide-binding protein [Gammaproteobacteria bacterium]|tara:strand:+ start:2287 stop:3183 length:897 start_codon:yes stop_codon:yes gene_type:complete